MMPLAPIPLLVTTDTAGILRSFTSIDLDCDLFVPADAAVIEGPADIEGVPLPWPLLKRVQRVVATFGPAPVFTGQRTSIAKRRGDGESSMTLELASPAKTLVDCPPPLGFQRPAGTLATFAGELCGQLGVLVAPGGVAAAVPRLDAVGAGASEPVWSTLDNLARQVGATLWCDEAGIVHIQELAPFYLLPPVDSLMYVPGNPANNIGSYELRDDLEERYATVYVKGHTPVRSFGPYASGLSTVLSVPCEGIAVDPELVALGVTRSLTIEDPRARTIAQAIARAKREIALRRINGAKLQVTVPGWTTTLGLPWRVTQMVSVTIPEDGIMAPFFIAGRRFMRDLASGTRTVLTLVEPGAL